MLELKLNNGKKILCDDENNTYSNDETMLNLKDENGNSISINSISKLES